MPRQDVVKLRLPDGTDVQAIKGSRLADIYVARGARELTDKGNPRQAPKANPLTEPAENTADAGAGYLEVAVETVHVPEDASDSSGD